MVAAIGLTGAYVAWAELADGMGDSAWNGKKLPSFETFVASLRPAGRESKASNDASVAAGPEPVSPLPSNPEEDTTLLPSQSSHNLPEKRPKSKSRRI